MRYYVVSGFDFRGPICTEITIMDNVKIRIHKIALIMCILPAAYAVFGEEPVTVGRCDMFEQSVRNNRPYEDPYRDVTLEVIYTHPVAGQRRFWGFYDGQQTWRIRFLPHLTGTWRYEATFSDGSPGLKGSFRCTSIPSLVGVNRANPIWFRRGAEPLLIRGFHVGDRFFAENWPEAKRAEFLDWAQKQGYNLLSIASHYLNRDAEGRGRGWDTPEPWPLNAAEFQKMERILDDLAARRILVYPFAGFFGQRSNYPRNPVDQELYIRYTLARIGPYWNVLLNVAGPEPNVGKTWMSSDEVVRLGRLIRELDVFGHPLSVHNRTGDDPYRDAEWSTFVTLQGPKQLNRKQLSDGLLRNLNPGKPLLAQETLWSGNKNHPRYSDTDLRKNAFVIHFSGASLVFGDMEGDSSSGFSGTMELAQRNQNRHDIIKSVWDFLESIPYHQMRPRRDLMDNGYCLANVGREYLVYLESRGAVNVTVENGPYAVRWINAENLSDRRERGTTRDGASLRSPEDGDDWILHLVRTGTSLPDPIHPS